MSPQTQAATTTATAGKRKMLVNALAVKSTNPVSKKTRKQKKHRPLAEQDQINAAAAAGEPAGGGVLLSAALPPARQLEFLLRSFERAAKMRLSPLELGTYSEGCMVQLTQGASQDVESFGDHVKRTFGASWKEDLCEGNLIEGLVEAGSPALLVISLGALRSLELLRGLKMFTRGCRAVKLFAKHMKVEEQGLVILEPRTARLVTSGRVRLNTLGCSSCFVAALLKARVNIACGTPSRIKKLIDMEALSLSRLKLVVLDMQRDPKSFNLFTLPQVSNEFWDLYKGYLDQKVKEGDTRICFYGAVSEKDANKVLPPAE